jgi:hypothetical protein
MMESAPMARLKSRQKQIPNSFQFYDPVLKWSPPRGASFQVICDGLRTARAANPGLSAAKGLSTDPNVIAEEVDAYNSAICERHGWTDFITGSPGGAAQVPFPQPQHRPALNVVRNAAVASGILVEWIASGAEAVPQEQANKRTATCAVCPKNQQGDWLSKFTVPVSNAIRAALEKKKGMKLETPSDHLVGSCLVCDCPMALKSWMKLEAFISKMPQAQKDGLNRENPLCWIVEEMEK